MLVSAVVAAALVFWMFRGTLTPESRRIPYGELVSLIEKDNVEEVEMRADEIFGKRRGDASKHGEAVIADRIPNMDERALVEIVKEYEVVLTGRPERMSFWRVLGGVLPFLLIPILFWGLSAQCGQRISACLGTSHKRACVRARLRRSHRPHQARAEEGGSCDDRGRKEARGDA